MAELMRERMLALGFDEVVFDRLGNVIGTIHGKRPGKTILLDGHMDTVDVIDAAEKRETKAGRHHEEPLPGQDREAEERRRELGDIFRRRDRNRERER